ncbi:putative F420-dependent oxidoreductase [Pseudonocardia dioxanivorans CB1190]|uniref:F420-dependent oxidoreductase n=1 Tax=Pseudonocardia dioxanivorans (strain ATCC 55486 / DSM 44775 / JCM 13855 / CB1190) TaxID=675635 RepID=F4CQG4_PSEUX|nr:putative F420-dependent oxidoreductase [Pseudonocardia dioxanivorans CB1190]
MREVALQPFSLDGRLVRVQIGIVTFLTDYGVEPVDLARAVEERGFESLFLTEHTHIPTSRESPWPGGGDLPERYSHTYDPFVAIGAMATVTERIVLGTAVSLINQHHPLNLAKQVASVDRIAKGRFEFGVGPGWNREEMANHGVDPRSRTARMLEMLEALKAVWTMDEAEYHGKFVDFDPIWSWPKPTRVPPILIGGGGPSVLDRVLDHGDGWIPLRVPVDGLVEFGERVKELQRRAADAGRGHIPVTMYGGAKRADALRGYADNGVDRVLFELADHSGPGARDAALAELDELAALGG